MSKWFHTVPGQRGRLLFFTNKNSPVKRSLDQKIPGAGRSVIRRQHSMWLHCTCSPCATQCIPQHRTWWPENRRPGLFRQQLFLGGRSCRNSRYRLRRAAPASGYSVCVRRRPGGWVRVLWTTQIAEGQPMPPRRRASYTTTDEPTLVAEEGGSSMGSKSGRWLLSAVCIFLAPSIPKNFPCVIARAVC